MKYRHQRSTIGNAQRYRILARDNFTCQYCGTTAVESTLQVDHVIPHSLCGSDKDDNLVAACFKCNIGKGNRHRQMPPSKTYAIKTIDIELEYLKKQFWYTVSKYNEMIMLYLKEYKKPNWDKKIIDYYMQEEDKYTSLNCEIKDKIKEYESRKFELIGANNA